MKKHHLASLLVASFGPWSTAWSCPAYLFAKDFPSLQKHRRQDVRVFALEAEGGTRRWKSLPVQVDPLDDKGVLLGPDDEPMPQPIQNLAKHDRIDLRREGFGPRATSSDPLPCAGAAVVHEIASPDQLDRYGYLTACPDDGGATLADDKNPVSVDQSIQRIDAPRFTYDYQPNNQLMYKTLTAKGPWGAPVLAAADADLNLHLDVKTFFTLDFANKDVESYVNSTTAGKVGAASSIDFFLSLLFFKINLKMATTASFFADSGHIPSLIDVPVEAPNRLNPGSGLLYSWTKKAASVDQTHPDKTLPNANPKELLASNAGSTATGLKYCKGQLCVFRLRGAVQGEQFGLDINVPKNVVEMGFFPVWVADVAQFKKDMGWDDEPSEGKDRVAIFFNNSGLHKGQYKIDQWIRVGKADEFGTTCPRPVKVAGQVKLSPPRLAH